ncbi:unnamed protein product [marine sediment metagenome]|uniref:DUF5658 domain-containing protein n=1 Tax=marine sediment metagenome TaxID=412755 RepID=X1AUW8_9ZZZZ
MINEGLKKMVVLGLFLIILQIMDIVTTNIGIKRGCEEGNPLIKNSLESGFPIYLVIIKIGLASLLTFFLSLGITILNWLFIALDFFLFAIVINNIIGIHLQRKWNRLYNIEMMKFSQVLVVRDWIALTQDS